MGLKKCKTLESKFNILLMPFPCQLFFKYTTFGMIGFLLG